MSVFHPLRDCLAASFIALLPAFDAEPLWNTCMSRHMRIELNCAKCDGNSFNLAHGAEDHSIICCTFCGHEIGTMAEPKERVAAEVLKRAANQDSK
jgi:hypothetical protein